MKLGRITIVATPGKGFEPTHNSPIGQSCQDYEQSNEYSTSMFQLHTDKILKHIKIGNEHFTVQYTPIDIEDKKTLISGICYNVVESINV